MRLSRLLQNDPPAEPATGFGFLFSQVFQAFHIGAPVFGYGVDDFQNVRQLLVHVRIFQEFRHFFLEFRSEALVIFRIVRDMDHGDFATGFDDFRDTVTYELIEYFGGFHTGK